MRTLSDLVMHDADVSAASCIAFMYHDGQFRRGGDGSIPYFLHPRTVAEMVWSGGGDRVQVIVAFLHDVAEDAFDDNTRDDFFDQVDQLFEPRVGAALRLLTKIPGETYDAYIARLVVSRNVDAWIVKRCDMLHNLSTAPPGDAYRAWSKYQTKLDILLHEDPREVGS